MVLQVLSLFLLFQLTSIAGTTYSYTGSVQTVTVPAGYSSMTVQLYGAGHNSYSSGTYTVYGGYGGSAQATFSVTPGSTIYIYVGGQGATGTAGYNGGGSGSPYGTCGSGATDIRTPSNALSDRILVAGGGGGCYADGGACSGGTAGNAGQPSGSAAVASCLAVSAAPTGGTQSRGGSAGNSTNGYSGTAGSLGQGGNGYVGGGAGGGGGYYGGGGSFATGGGGGSSYVSPSGTSTAFPASTWSGHGQATIVFSTSPTSQPSRQPSRQPSSQPSAQPNSKPSRQPTRRPTSQPSRRPSHQPSRQPSTQPTSQPTAQPFIRPSSQPLSHPSRQPSSQPTTQPTGQPVSHPSSRPSRQPTSRPSLQPSSQPTSQPSSQPVARPSAQPSKQPSVSPTGQPSAQPSKQPSGQPSVQPTVCPSVLPSINPTGCPSSRPSHQPSSLPSSLPSDNPSVQPTLQPSVEPSGQPTLMPTVQPTSLPSTQPSGQPTSQPQSLPSSKPSCQPSCQPNSEPSEHPTSQPSSQPLSQPSSQPSVVPSCMPSVQPTCVPSVLPTDQPTGQPSHQPVGEPTTVPTCCPSSQPSGQPSSRPSFQPSCQPSVTPSSQPSSYPTDQPSLHPTGQPSVQPSMQPNAWPSSQPTSSPSQQPSRQPSVHPTAQPGVSPSSQPTSQPTVNPFLNLGRLPSNASISVLGDSTLTLFKIVLPFQQVSRVVNKALSDIQLVDRNMIGNATIVVGSRTPASLSLLQQSIQLVSCHGSVSAELNGRSVSVMPDVNGDGYDDLIIGDPFAARCYVVFGNEERANMSVGFTIYGESEGDLTGWSVSAAGDVNNDTFRDIIIGAPNARGVGAFYIVYGRNVTSDVYLSSLSSDIGVAVYGATKADALGLSVSDAGDVNKDGYDDVIVGAALTSSFYGGAAFVVYGGLGLQSIDSIVHMSRDEGYKLSGPSYSLSGYSVSGAGDVNGDGYDDVLIGSSPLRKTLVPTAYLVYGSGVKPENVVLSQLTASQGAVLSGGGVFVSSVGDVDADGYSDVLIGTTSEPFSSQSGFLVTFDASVCHRASPTVAPSAAPTIAPSRRVSRAPSVYPSRRPSVVSTSHPSLQPQEPNSDPTRSPSAVPSQFSSRPTELPSILSTGEPSLEPSESPSERPSAEPTDEPSIDPTAASTVVPTLLPSSDPSEVPVDLPSAAPTSLMPTDASRAPFTRPTIQPSGEYSVVIDGTQGSSYMRNNLTSSVVYVVNSSIDVRLSAHGACGTFVVLKQPDTTFTTEYFNFSCDVIDLSSWSEYRSMDDLSIRTGSIVIHLKEGQTFKIENAEPQDISGRNFRFAEVAVKPKPNKNHKISSTFVLSAILAVGIAVCILYQVYKLWMRSRVVVETRQVVVVIHTSLPLDNGTFKWLHRDVSEKLESDGRSSSSESKGEKDSEISFDWKNYSDRDETNRSKSGSAKSGQDGSDISFDWKVYSDLDATEKGGRLQDAEVSPAESGISSHQSWLEEQSRDSRHTDKGEKEEDIDRDESRSSEGDSDSDEDDW